MSYRNRVAKFRNISPCGFFRFAWIPPDPKLILGGIRHPQSRGINLAWSEMSPLLDGLLGGCWVVQKTYGGVQGPADPGSWITKVGPERQKVAQVTQTPVDTFQHVTECGMARLFRTPIARLLAGWLRGRFLRLNRSIAGRWESMG